MSTTTQTPAIVRGMALLASFLDDTADSLQKATSLRAAVQTAVPWASALGHAASEALPVVRFFTTIASNWPSTADPNELVATACSLAFTRSFQLATDAIPPEQRERDTQLTPTISSPAQIGANADYDFSTESVDTVATHQFYVDAETLLATALNTMEIPPALARQLTLETRARFTGQLRELLAVDATKRFDSVARLLNQPADRLALARAALLEHARVQRAKFDEHPVLPGEPYALAAVYVTTDCGTVTWSDIRPEAKEGTRVRWTHKNPFHEGVGGRHDLLDVTLKKLSSPDFRDAIVVQGVAGAGKSSYTLRLSDELLRRGLVPVRIRMRDIVVDKEIREAIGQAVNSTLLAHAKTQQRQCTLRCADAEVLPEALLRETIDFDGTAVCPYVLILDGWDELTISSTTDFRRRVDQFLERVRRDIIRAYQGSVRVVLTGRPSHDVVSENGFLTAETILLTMRPFTPAQLRSYVNKLAWVLDEYNSSWRFAPRTIEPSIARYSQSASQSDDVLSFPLLAFIAIRVMSEPGGPSNDLSANRALLLRRLVDMTVDKSGKHARDELDDGAAKLRGSELRRLLRVTAASVTIANAEDISERELVRRRRMWDPLPGRPHGTMDRELGISEFGKLMISFYFRSGSDGAIEFAHKSFREYLFAEELVSAIKDASREGASFGATFPSARFGGGESAHAAAIRVLRLLCSWGALETMPLVMALLNEELLLSLSSEMSQSTLAWTQTRDFLARLWEWLQTGSPEIRPTTYNSDGLPQEDMPVSWALAKWSSVEFAPEKDLQMPSPSHAVHYASRAVLELSVALHDAVARVEAPGWGSSTNVPSEMLATGAWEILGPTLSPYQTRVRTPRGTVTLFAPGGQANGEGFIGAVVAQPGNGTLRSCDLRSSAVGSGEYEWCLLENALVHTSGDYQSAIVLRHSMAKGLRMAAAATLLAQGSNLVDAVLVCDRLVATTTDFSSAVITIAPDAGYRTQGCILTGAVFRPRLLRDDRIHRQSPAHYGLVWAEWCEFRARFRRFVADDEALAQLRLRAADAGRQRPPGGEASDEDQ